MMGSTVMISMELIHQSIGKILSNVTGVGNVRRIKETSAMMERTKIQWAKVRVTSVTLVINVTRTSIQVQAHHVKKATIVSVSMIRLPVTSFKLKSVQKALTCI